MDELLDIVNDDDIVIDQQMRSTVHQRGLQHRGVHVLLFTSDGRMLVQKRSADRATCPSAWDCSVSEHVKAGEDYMQSAIRGMKEEMGLEDIQVTPLAKIRMNYGPNDNEISMIYEGTVDPAWVKFDTVEIEEVGYYSIDEIQHMMSSEDVKFCGWFVEIMKWHTGAISVLTVLKKY